jgi:phage tail P2-like protein
MDLNNISILGLMPQNLAADKNIKMAAEAFDGVLRDIIKKIPDVGMIPNLALNKIVNETLIDLLAWQFHVDFYEPGLPFKIKRELVLKSLDWHYRKGTPSVVEEIVSTVFTRAKIEEWYEYGGRPYGFRIATEEQKPDAETMKKLIRAINSVKNTRSFLDDFTHLLDFIEDPVEINEKALINALIHFVETMEAQDGAFGMTSEFSFADRILTRSSIVYGGVKEFDRYNGVHSHNRKIVFQGQDGNIYNGVYLHNGGIPFRGDESKYKHDGAVLFGSGLSDVFAFDNISTAIIIDFVDTVLLQENLIIDTTKNIHDCFPTSQIYDGGMSHDGKYKWNAAYEVLKVSKAEELVDGVDIEDGPLELAAASDFMDVETVSEAVEPYAGTIGLEENVEIEEEAELSGGMDLSDFAGMSDDFSVSMIGYWTYGGADNPRHNHDGSIGFNYGNIVPA